MYNITTTTRYNIKYYDLRGSYSSKLVVTASLKYLKNSNVFENDFYDNISDIIVKFQNLIRNTHFLFENGILRVD